MANKVNCMFCVFYHNLKRLVGSNTCYGKGEEGELGRELSYCDVDSLQEARRSPEQRLEQTMPVRSGCIGWAELGFHITS